jgi:hypothetical protein
MRRRWLRNLPQSLQCVSRRISTRSYLLLAEVSVREFRINPVLDRIFSAYEALGAESVNIAGRGARCLADWHRGLRRDRCGFEGFIPQVKAEVSPTHLMPIQQRLGSSRDGDEPRYLRRPQAEIRKPTLRRANLLQLKEPAWASAQGALVNDTADGVAMQVRLPGMTLVVSGRRTSPVPDNNRAFADWARACRRHSGQSRLVPLSVSSTIYQAGFAGSSRASAPQAPHGIGTD